VQFLFADHALDTDTRELRRGDIPIPVQPRVFDLLAYLLQNRERVVSKHDLLSALWGGRTVADSTVATHINAARKAVSDSASEQKLIRTIARRGIRFVGAVACQPRGNAPARDAAPPRETFQPPTSMSPSFDRPAIVVLPFVNMSGEVEQEYFSDGISEDIITALSRLRWFFVIARNSSFSYKGKSVHLKQIAEELGVGYVVEGSVRKAGERVRITVQLNDITTGSHLWAERYDRNLAGVFAVQDEITDAIVAAIEPKLYAAEDFRARRKAQSLDAWNLVMRGLSDFWRMTKTDNLTAQTLLEQAIAVDPNYAQARAVLAVSHMFGVQMGWEVAASVAPIAERTALAAVRADEEDPWAHLALAMAYSHTGSIEDTLAEYEMALRLNPNFALAQAGYALVLSWGGRARESAAAADRAIRLSPRDPFSAIYYGVAGYAAFVARDYGESIRLARESIRQRNDFVAAHRVITAAAGMAGDTDLAKSMLKELRRAHPNVSLAWIRSWLPVRDPGEREHFLEGLRRAGLE
jgi:TolB-like protein/Tfp pilus assembly protein PilF